MNKVKYTIMGIALFVYTLAVIGVTTMIVHPNPAEVDQDTTLTEQDIDNMCDERESVGF
ncbi:hypothetical protein [Virgibacillus phasianinus]|uniref:hypothetical protein n=1 Tax=Virgibacillus phasianinus TaxID=2017483 RepID=UPI0012FDDCC6|nr:hypothetical protein [Virgibacillus phasianinus]